MLREGSDREDDSGDSDDDSYDDDSGTGGDSRADQSGSWVSSSESVPPSAKRSGGKGAHKRRTAGKGKGRHDNSVTRIRNA